MNSGPLRAARFARHWFRPDGSVTQDEVVLDGDHRHLEATRLRPADGGRDAAWILLHGITRPGRRHPVLLRFAEALAASGATVLIPEIPEWRALALSPGPAREATLAALRSLQGPEGGPGRLGEAVRPGLVGFSFGAPQAIRMATDPELAGGLSCAAGFGGYATLEGAVEFLWSGRHSWQGQSYRLRPDPYGRWVVGANFLTRLSGLEDADDVARGLRELAAVAGDRQIPSWDPVLDELKDRLELKIAPPRRGIFRQFAPPAEFDPPRGGGHADRWAPRLSEAGLDAEPLLDLPLAVEARIPVVLLHGRHDPLIPFTETLRLEQRVRSPSLNVAVTSLFEHSQESEGRGPGWPGELWRFGRTLSLLLGSV